MKVNFGDNNYEELQAAIEKEAMVLVPVGQVEEHGPHLAVKTDALIAERLCAAAARELAPEFPVLVTPTVWSGYSTREVLRWPGCLTLRLTTLIEMMYDISAGLVRMGFKKAALVNCHGNHPGALEVVVRRIADDFGVYLALTNPMLLARPEIMAILEKGAAGSCHAGEFETSVMLYLDPDSVRMEKASDVDILRIKEGLSGPGAFVSTWGVQKSLTGVFGAPRTATAAKGEALFRALVEGQKKFLRSYARLEPAA